LATYSHNYSHSYCNRFSLNHYLLGIEENHNGDIHYFNKAAALQAISATNQFFNCGAGTDCSSISVRSMPVFHHYLLVP